MSISVELAEWELHSSEEMLSEENSPGSLVGAPREDDLDEVLALHPLFLLLAQLASLTLPNWLGQQLTDNVESKYSMVHLQWQRGTRKGMYVHTYNSECK